MDLSGQEVSADHLCGRVCVQADDRGGRGTQEDKTHLSVSDGTGRHKGGRRRIQRGCKSQVARGHGARRMRERSLQIKVEFE